MLFALCRAGVVAGLLWSSLVGVAAAQNNAVPHWLWTSKTAGPNEVAFFRQVFTVAGEVKSATFTGASDDAMTVFVNGQQIVQHNTWNAACYETITDKLKPGENVIAIRGLNGGGGPAAVIGRIDIVLADGRKQAIVTDTSWKASQDAAGNFRALRYDDSGWIAAVSLGRIGAAPWGALDLDPNAKPSILATKEDAISVPEGFQVELLYSVPKTTEGSWVSMTPDPKGRLIVCDQYGGLFRVTPGADYDSTQVEKLTAAIGEAQGLLYAFDSLYVVVNGGAAQGSGLYRLRDTTGDDQFDEVKLLKRLQGGGEHGPHAVVLGPDNMLYVAAGNHTKIPEGIEPHSPHRNWAEDHLLPRNPDGRGHATGVMAPGGWVARTDPNGEKWELICAGFRNQYDIGFNQDGELFTYDSDMEWDTGAPWYRATRVNHCVSAGEYGWRFGTGKWPDYYIDSLGAVVDIGLGSPTGVVFGTGAKFPARYQRAFFINDWTYGKIYAVHLQPQGASYTATFDTFVEGKPLPVTDIVVNHDGALYFTIGGRRTQSGLYRVTYVGDESTAPVGPLENEAAAQARALRRQLEAFHGRENPAAIDAAWPHLSSPDRALRYAARVAVEHQDPALWTARALADTRPAAVLQTMCALARVGDKSLQPQLVAKLNSLPYARLTEQQLLDACRVYGLSFIRQGEPSDAVRDSAIDALSPLYPSPSELVNRELAQVLTYLKAPDAIEKSLKLFEAARTQQDQMHYMFVLRNATDRMTAAQQRAFFGWCNLAESGYRGGNSFTRFVEQIRNDGQARLSEKDRLALKDLIENKAAKVAGVVEVETTRQFVHNWQMSDLEPLIGQIESGRSFERGREVYQAAQCYKCHRFGGEGGDTGPDLTGVGNRFDVRYILESVIEPSKVISDQYKNEIFLTTDGEVLTGRVIEDAGDGVIKVRTDPFATQLVELPTSKIEDRKVSPISEMPQGAINVLTKEEILDLIAYMRSGGNPDDKAFTKK